MSMLLCGSASSEDGESLPKLKEEGWSVSGLTLLDRIGEPERSESESKRQRQAFEETRWCGIRWEQDGRKGWEIEFEWARALSR
eukprot:3389869-Rhodomonas_salina.1